MSQTLEIPKERLEKHQFCGGDSTGSGLPQFPRFRNSQGLVSLQPGAQSPSLPLPHAPAPSPSLWASLGHGREKAARSLGLLLFKGGGQKLVYGVISTTF